MNKRKIIASLNNIANSLDESGLFEEANRITEVMTKLAQPWHPNDPSYEESDYEDRCPDCESKNLVFDNEGEILMCNECGWDVNDSGAFRSHNDGDDKPEADIDPYPNIFEPGYYDRD